MRETLFGVTTKFYADRTKKRENTATTIIAIPATTNIRQLLQLLVPLLQVLR